MSSFLPVIGILVAAAITPGPNNTIVMEAGARAGFGAALRLMLAVVGGSLLLLLLVRLGVGDAVQTWPALERVLGIAGGGYLAWLGLALVLRGSDQRTDARQTALPLTVPGAAGFQLLNPKAWILVTTADAAMPRDGVLALAILMALVTTACLALWAAAGAASARVLVRPGRLRAFDRAMGALLAASAFGILARAVAP